VPYNIRYGMSIQKVTFSLLLAPEVCDDFDMDYFRFRQTFIGFL
jgi:hypothetical protein